MTIARTIGIEIELLAPAGLSRQTMADALADRIKGVVYPSFCLGYEPSAHPKVNLFCNLTPAFTVRGSNGETVARLLDDPTIVSDLVNSTRSNQGWHRVVSDDRRILRLLEHHLDPMDPAGPSLKKAAELFGFAVSEHAGTYNLTNSDGASLALVTGLSGERERPTEIVSPRLTADGVRDWLVLVLTTATDLSFTVPQEAATHFHFDAAPFDNAIAFRRLAQWYWSRRTLLREAANSNPKCRALGEWPREVIRLVNSIEFVSKPWPEVKCTMAELFRDKFFDINVMNLLLSRRDNFTIEFRFLPVSLDAELALEWVWIMGGLLSLIADGVGDFRHEPVAARAVSSDELMMEFENAATLRVLGPMDNGSRSEEPAVDRAGLFLP